MKEIDAKTIIAIEHFLKENKPARIVESVDVIYRKRAGDTVILSIPEEEATKKYRFVIYTKDKLIH